MTQDQLKKGQELLRKIENKEEEINDFIKYSKTIHGRIEGSSFEKASDQETCITLVVIPEDQCRELCEKQLRKMAEELEALMLEFKQL